MGPDEGTEPWKPNSCQGCAEKETEIANLRERIKNLMHENSELKKEVHQWRKEATG
jgi:predicted nuclease with TOPRIM domain